MESADEAVPEPEPDEVAPAAFSDSVLKVLQAAGEATIDADGPFRELTGERRIRAILIVFKSRKKVVCADGKWRVATPNDVKSPLPQPADYTTGLGVSIKDMTLADFYRFVKEDTGI
jgi:hypothetical protein